MTETVYATAYPIYRDRGWSPIKLHAGTKFPPPAGFTGHDGADPSGADMHAWAQEEPDGNTAIRLAVGYIGIDTDAYDGKTGAQTLAEAEKRWGPLPYSPRSTSRDDGVSGIRLYRVPTGYEAVTVLGFPELGIGDIEICQHHHRYVMCWPSIHPSGRRYRWLGVDDGPLVEPPTPADIPDLPARWLDGLRKSGHNDADIGGQGCYDVRQALTRGQMSRRVAAKLGEAILACDGTSRHDATRDNVLALLRYGKQGDGGVLDALKALQKAFVAAVGNDREGGRVEAVEEFRDFVNGPRVAQLLAEPDTTKWARPDEPPPQDDEPDGATGQDRQPPADDTAPTTWEPVDLGPWLRGEITQPQPCLGIHRSDGVQLIYPGREHAFVGETESGKTWLALGCVAAELCAGHHVVYIHYEEADPASTIERLGLLGVDPALIAGRLKFVTPARPVRTEWIAALLDPAPALVVHDGVNEAMSLHGADIMAADGAASFRRRLVVPFLRAGAASIACDHLPKDHDGRSRDAYGSVHKGNALDGARILLEPTASFGRRMRGVSFAFVTKDRPGQLRTHGRPSKLPGKTFIGTLVVDDSETFGPDFAMRFFAPKDDEQPTDSDPAADLADTVFDVIAASPDHTVASMRALRAQLCQAGHKLRNTKISDAVDDLIAAGRVTETSDPRRSTGYRAVLSGSREET
jgi:hypothetical protein